MPMEALDVKGLVSAIECKNCCRPFKSKQALNRHVKLCVANVNAEALDVLGRDNVNRKGMGFFKLNQKPLEIFLKKSLSTETALAIKNQNIKGKKNKLRLKTLLEQVDSECHHQLIQYKINEILNEVPTSQELHLTQPLQPSKLSISYASSLGVWKAAKQESSPYYQDNSDQTPGQVHPDTSERTSYGSQNSVTMEKLSETERILSNEEPYVDDKVGITKQDLSILCMKPNLVCVYEQMVNNEKFSDLTLKSAQGRIWCHKILLSSYYPQISLFLENHSEVNLENVREEDILLWLKSVYLGAILDVSMFSEDTVRHLQQMLQFASNWKVGDSSNSHKLKTHKNKHIPCKKMRRSKSVDNMSIEMVEASNRIKSTIEEVILNYCAPNTPEVQSSDEQKTDSVNKISNEVVILPHKNSKKAKKSNPKKDTRYKKYAPVTTLCTKISPLLSTFSGLKERLADSNSPVESNSLLEILIDLRDTTNSLEHSGTNFYPNVEKLLSGSSSSLKENFDKNTNYVQPESPGRAARVSEDKFDQQSPVCRLIDQEFCEDVFIEDFMEDDL